MKKHIAIEKQHKASEFFQAFDAIKETMSRGPTFSSKTPHFFKIILEDTLQEKRLLIPKKFVRLYGETLSDSVSLKLPCGSQWKIELIKHEGKIWLGKGWTNLADHYSIIRGHMIVFQYEGNSEFKVFILDTSTVEIDYPLAPSHNIDDETNIPENVKISEDFPGCHRAGKRMRTSPLDQPETSSFQAEHNRAFCGKVVFEHSSETKVSQSSVSEVKGEQDSCRRSFIRSIKRISKREKIAALKKTEGFTSDHPFFKVVLQWYHVNGHFVNIPVLFARRYLKNKPKYAVLGAPTGRGKTWPVKHSLVVHGGGKSVARLSCGWKEFVQDNKLEVGDVCVFVMLKTEEVMFEVSSFRVNGNSTTRVDHHNKSATSVDSDYDDSLEQEENGSESYGTSDDETIMPSSRHNSTSKKARKKALLLVEKSKFLERVHFVSQKPFYKVIVQPSYVYNVPIPKCFAKAYIKGNGEAIVRTPNSTKSWPAQYRTRYKKTGKYVAMIYCGWKLFAEDNKLEVGDMCIIELTNEANRILFDVSIVRSALVDDGNSRCNHACDTPIAKPNEDERVIIEID